MKMEPDGQIAEMLWGTPFEAEQRDFICRVTQRGMTVVNIGANSGLYAILTSKLVGTEGIVHAFEPSTANYNTLRKNLQLNDCGNVMAQHMALSDSAGTLSLRFDPKNPQLDGHFYVEKQGNGESEANVVEEVRCDTLDSYLATFAASRLLAVDIIVIDVEGAELDVFKGATETFRHSPGLIICFECTQRISEIDNLLRGSGFRYFNWDVTLMRLNEVALTLGPNHCHAR